MIFINQLVSALCQLLVLTLIPFVWYVIRNKKILGFFKWMGLQRSSKVPLKEMTIIFLGFLAVMALQYIAFYRSGSLTYSGFVFDSYSQSGWSLQTVTVILIWSIIQTSLSEEIFFRGFLCKRLINKYGFHVGNFIHALLFGCMH
ncbi:MAG: hypothetical protein K2G70_01020, partial [Turicibacter sp.]|nr:hypothetical protein [Turicibacter sp.]